MTTPLKIELIVDDKGTVQIKQFAHEVDVAGIKGQAAFARTGKSIDDMNRHTATAHLHILKVVTAVTALTATAYGLKKLVDSASNLNETVSKSNTIFAANAAEIMQWSTKSATAFGMSRQAALENAASLGNMFKQLGAGTAVAAQNSKSMVELSADIASFHNVAGGATQVLEAMQAAFRGEYDSLQRYIPTIQAATVEQQALADTGKKSAKELTALEKATAAMTIIIRDAGDATGDFARTSGEAANQERILNAQIEDVKAAIGTGLLPAYRDMLIEINKWITANQTLLSQDIPAYVRSIADTLKSIVNIYKSLPDGVVGAAGAGIVGRILTGSTPIATAAAVIVLLNAQLKTVNLNLSSLSQKSASAWENIKNLWDVISGKRDWNTGEWKELQYGISMLVNGIPTWMGKIEELNKTVTGTTETAGAAGQAIAGLTTEMEKQIESLSKLRAEHSKDVFEALYGISDEETRKRLINETNLETEAYAEKLDALGVYNDDVIAFTKAVNDKYIELLRDRIGKEERLLKDQVAAIAKSIKEQYDTETALEGKLAQEKENIWERYSITYQQLLIGEKEFARQNYLKDLEVYLLVEQQKTGITDDEIAKRKKIIMDAYDEQKTAETEMEKLWVEGLNRVQEAFADTFYDAMTGELDDLGDIFDSFFKDILRMVAELAAKMTMYDLFGVGKSGWGEFFSSISGKSGGGGGGIFGSLLGLSGNAYQLISGETFATTVAGWFGSGAMAGAGTAFGVAAGETAASYGSLYGFGIGNAAIQSGAVTTGVAGAGAGAGMSAVAAGGYAAAIAAAWYIGTNMLAKLLKGSGGPSSFNAVGQITTSQRSDELFNIPEITSAYIHGGEWSDEDAQKAAERFGAILVDTLSVYETIFQNVSKESKDALKAAAEALDFESYSIYYEQMAAEGASTSFSLIKTYEAAETMSDEIKAALIEQLAKVDWTTGWSEGSFTFAEAYRLPEIEFDDAKIQELYNRASSELFYQIGEILLAGGAGDTSQIPQIIADWIAKQYADALYVDVARDTTAAQAIQEMMGGIFNQYIGEALTNLAAEPVFEYMSDEIKAAFGTLNLDLFLSDIDQFTETFNETAAKIHKAASIWEKLENISQGIEYTKADTITAMAQAWGEAYKTIAEAYTGAEISDEDMAVKIKEYYSELAAGTKNIDDAVYGVTELDVAVGALNGTVDAYIEQLKALGVAVEEITELEEMRMAAMNKLLEDYKHTIGVIDDETYYSAMFDKIWSKYSQYFASYQEFIDAFTNATVEDIQNWLKTIGSTMDWTDVANDVGWLVKALQSLGEAAGDTADAIEQTIQSIKEWQAGLRGEEDEYIVEYFKEKYGVLDNITKEWVDDLVDMFSDMDPAMVQAIADYFGVTVQELMSDINSLISAFGDLSGSMSEVAADIRAILDSLRADIGSLTGSGGGGAIASSIASQINAVLAKDLKDLTMTDLLGAAQLMQDWYSAAVQEAKDAVDAQKKAIQGQIDVLQEQKEALALQIRVTEAVESLIDSVDQAIRDIKYSDLNVSLPAQKAEESKVDLQALYQAALTGGVAEVQEFLQFAPTALQQAQTVDKSSEAYQSYYDQVMGWMEQIKGKAEAGGYDAMILAELQGENEELTVIQRQIDALQKTMSNLEPDYSALAAQFETWASQIESMMATLERVDLILSIDWGEFPGDIKEVLQMLIDLVNVYGWDNEFVLKWTSDMTQWLAKQPIEDILWYLDEVAKRVPGGWDSEYMLHFITDLAGWLITDIDKVHAVLDYLVSIFGDETWTKPVTIQFITALLENGISWADMKDALLYFYGLSEDGVQEILVAVFLNTTPFESWQEFMEAWNVLGMADSWATKYLQALYVNGSITDTSLKAWANFVLAFKQAGLPDETAQKILAAVYSRVGGIGELALWSDFKAAMAASGIGVDDEAWKTIQAAYNNVNGQFPTWTALSAALATAGLDDTTTKTIEAAYKSGTMTWTELEDMLEATGTPESVIRKILADVSATTTVKLTELDAWKAMVGLLVWIGENTWEIAKQLGAQYADWSKFAQFAPSIWSWAPYFSGGLGRQPATEIALPVSGGGGGGGTCNFPAGITHPFNALDVQVWGENKGRIYTADGALYAYVAPWNGKGAFSISGTVTIGNPYLNARIFASNGGTLTDAGNGCLNTKCYPCDNWATAMVEAFADIDRTRANLYEQNTHWLNADVAGRVINAYAEGGIVSDPTLALIGEAGYPEAVIPMKDGLNIPVKWTNGGSTQAGANNDEEVALLREQVRLLAKIANQNGQPLKIEGLGRFAKSKADEVIVTRNRNNKLNSTERYFQ